MSVGVTQHLSRSASGLVRQHGEGHAWMRTASGGWIDVLNPRPEDILLEDLAVHLSREYRYGNATLLTVAEHAVLVSYACDPVYAPEGLHHDDPEGYLGDQVGTYKHQRPNHFYRYTEELLHDAVARKFGLDTGPGCYSAVKAADDAVFLAECRALWPDEFEAMRESRGAELVIADVEVRCLGMEAAAALYLARHEELFAGRANVQCSGPKRGESSSGVDISGDEGGA